MKIGIVIVGLAFLPAIGVGQEHQHAAGSAAPALRLSWGATGIGMVTHASPAQAGEDRTETYFTQPNLFAHAGYRGLSGNVTINLEGLTLKDGELNIGTWGEGFYDKRHPHTYVHEAIGSLAGETRGARWSLSAGKGFAPFGTDDPMVRPMLKFPANHHLGQLLERLVVVGAVAKGPFIVEGGVFNGDEPMTSKSMGTLDRVGDSWSVRATAIPLHSYELQASYAAVESPEEPNGFGLDQRKFSVSLRHERLEGAHPHYFLVEWLRTEEMSRGEEVFSLSSLLGEGSVAQGPWRAATRIERTIRPEEERSGSIFRSPWPHIDQHIFGFTRWWIVSANVSRAFQGSGWSAIPVLEVAHARPKKDGLPFTPEDLYGTDRLWSFSFAVRLSAGAPHHRMGRYGAAQVSTTH